MNTSINICCLHGWGFKNSVFSVLEEANTGYKFSKPCLYKTAKNINDYSFTAIAQRVSEKLHEDVFVVGWSMGGLIAIEMAACSPHVKGVALMASAPSLVNRPDWQNTIGAKEFESLEKEFKHHPMAAIKKIIALTAYGEKKQKETASVLEKYSATQEDLEVLASWLGQIAKADMRRLLSTLNVPIMMLLGEKDALIKPEVAQQVDYKDISCQTIKDSGHAPFMNHPAAVIKSIDLFISKHDDY